MSGERTIERERFARAGLLRIASPAGEAARIASLEGAEAAWAWVLRQAEQLGHPVPDAADDFTAAARVGARLVIPGDREWPAQLADLALVRGDGANGSPFGLWVRGAAALAETCARSVAVVGARAATDYGGWVAADLASGLAEREVCVVSGAAFGIDGSAHRGALASHGQTVAVLAGGIDVPYPRAHEGLIDRIAHDGLVISEAPPGRRPRRESFLIRNRIIAALSGGAVLVEAGLRSGGRNTLAHAAALGRPRMAVPGPVTSAASAGCHALLRSDPEVRLVTNAAEIVEEIGRLGDDLAPVSAGPQDVRDTLDAAERAFLDAMPAREVVFVGTLAAELRLSVPQVIALASQLIDRDLLVADDGGYRLTAAARAPTPR